MSYKNSQSPRTFSGGGLYVLRKGSHSSDVNGREHDKDFVTEVGYQLGCDLCHDKI